MKIFISYVHQDNEFVQKLTSMLQADGHVIFGTNPIHLGSNIQDEINKNIAKADVIIPVISKYSSDSFSLRKDFYYFLQELPSRGIAPLVIPVVRGDTAFVPPDLRRSLYIVFPDDESEISLHESKSSNPGLNQLKLALARFESELEKGKQEEQESEEKVQTGLSNYINEVFAGLKKGEIINKALAIFLYFLSISALVVTIFIANAFVSNSDWKPENLVSIIAHGVVSLLIIIIMISLSKLLYTLARSFMVEAIRCSDRRHAISFGKFFLDAYGSEATREEVLKAFSSWNIDNGSTSFRNQSGEDFDPKIADLISVFKKNK